ncbi:hypothetical protein JCM31447_18490 [Fluviispira sanaruensis]|uniref:Uncharacterized protein n=2 Tax=Fluviispira sanaruensis TaxID=2493639 RepID=A0A4P2VJP7_FLUSA|nr:hypothetical protein JCM31447_18490 [Fluviispira sanaruensis]
MSDNNFMLSYLKFQITFNKNSFRGKFMKNRINYLIIFLTLFSYNNISAKTTVEKINENIINSDQTVSKSVQRVLNLCGIFPKNYSLNEVLIWVKGDKDPKYSLVRQPGEERWEKKENLIIKNEDLDEIIEIILNEIGLGQRIEPSLSNYNGILFLGASLPSVRERLKYLNANIENKKILPVTTYLIGGERKLSEKIGEGEEQFYNKNNGIIEFRSDYKVPKTPLKITDEREMLKLVFSQSLHPKLQNKIALSLSEKDPNEHRATTKSTIKYFFNDYFWNLKNGNYIVISNQPFVLYQKLVMQKICKLYIENQCNGIHFDFIGSELTLNKSYSVDEKRKFATKLLENLAQNLILLKN